MATKDEKNTDYPSNITKLEEGVLTEFVKENVTVNDDGDYVLALSKVIQSKYKAEEKAIIIRTLKEYGIKIINDLTKDDRQKAAATVPTPKEEPIVVEPEVVPEPTPVEEEAEEQYETIEIEEIDIPVNDRVAIVPAVEEKKVEEAVSKPTPTPMTGEVEELELTPVPEIEASKEEKTSVVEEVEEFIPEVLESEPPVIEEKLSPVPALKQMYVPEQPEVISKPRIGIENIVEKARENKFLEELTQPEPRIPDRDPMTNEYYEEPAPKLVTDIDYGSLANIYDYAEDSKYVDDFTLERFLILHGSREVINEMLASLPEDEKFVIIARYGFGGNKMTYSEIASALSMTLEMVRSREARALKKFRHPDWIRKFRSDIIAYLKYQDYANAQFSLLADFDQYNYDETATFRRF